MKNYKVSDNFKISEFGYIKPHPRLLGILQWLRDKTGGPITITDNKRTPCEHVEIYKKLEKEKKIPTKGNGLGDKELIDIIPWGSRHLPSFDCPYLRGVDINCFTSKGNKITGHTISKLLLDYSETIGVPIGLGIGHHFIHIDVDREKTTVWDYNR